MALFINSAPALLPKKLESEYFAPIDTAIQAAGERFNCTPPTNFLLEGTMHPTCLSLSSHYWHNVLSRKLTMPQQDNSTPVMLGVGLITLKRSSVHSGTFWMLALNKRKAHFKAKLTGFKSYCQHSSNYSFTLTITFAQAISLRSKKRFYSTLLNQFNA